MAKSKYTNISFLLYVHIDKFTKKLNYKGLGNAAQREPMMSFRACQDGLKGNRIKRKIKGEYYKE